MELSVLAELKVPATFARLLSSTGLQAGKLKRVLAVLDRLGVIELLKVSEASMTAPSQDGALTTASEFVFQHLIPVVTNDVLDEKITVARTHFSFTSEQFKSLKVQIGQASAAVPLKVLTVSSPDPQDGKSFVSANLAFSFAMDPGRRVIIVDCDLRKPSLQNYLGVSSDPGLLQYVTDGSTNPYCYVRRIENLYFLTAGGVATNPIEVLSMNKVRQLIERLKRDFDTVILDSPPYSPIADARIVTALSDGLLIVLRRGKTSYSSTDLAFKSIDRNKLLGVVFNDVQPILANSDANLGYYSYDTKKQISSTRSKNYLEP